jgi:uncharacterized glyoxalase superfamily protein PhnB
VTAIEQATALKIKTANNGAIAMDDPKRPSLSVGLSYRDPRAALMWLEAAFGFETSMVVEAEDGSIAHSEMRVGDSYIMVGSEYDQRHRSPANLGGANTQSVHVQLEGGLDAHCARARAAGAVICREPEDQFYGDRVYEAIDPDGHVWTFAQTLAEVSNEAAGKAGGYTIRDRL